MLLQSNRKRRKCLRLCNWTMSNSVSRMNQGHTFGHVFFQTNHNSFWSHSLKAFSAAGTLHFREAVCFQVHQWWEFANSWWDGTSKIVVVSVCNFNTAPVRNRPRNSARKEIVSDAIVAVVVQKVKRIDGETGLTISSTGIWNIILPKNFHIPPLPNIFRQLPS